MGIGSVIFILVFLGSLGFFLMKVLQIVKYIKLGRSEDRSDNKGERFKTMVMIALGQSKMVGLFF